MSKHLWTERELQIVCVCYKHNVPIELALLLTNTTDAKSMEMRYRNCLFLDKGKVENSLSHASKKLVDAWNEVNAFYPVKKEEEFDWETLVLSLMFVSFLFQVVSIVIS